MICNDGYQTENTTITQLLYSFFYFISEEICGFEDGNICGYDIGKWSVGTAKQLASTTGLLTDLTTGTEKGIIFHLLFPIRNGH